jgi:hypothetical protein
VELVVAVMALTKIGYNVTAVTGKDSKCRLFKINWS